MKNKLLSLMLSATMLMSLAVPVAMAADDPPGGTPQLFVVEKDGNGTPLATYAASGTGTYTAATAIESYEISNGAGGNTTGEQTNGGQNFSVGLARVSATLPTTRSIQWTIENADRDLYLTLELAAPDQYIIGTSSDTYGAGANTGIGATATCDMSKTSSSVAAGGQVEMTFSPKVGHTITKLNIRNVETDVNLYDANTQTVTAGNNTFNIVKEAATGKVTVTCASVANDVYVTALTTPLNDYTLTVQHDTHCAANISSVAGDVLKSQDVLLTPEANYDIATISIEDGDHKGTLNRATSTLQINGKSYKAVWNLNGSVTLTVPAATADVEVYASSVPTDNSYFVQATPATNVAVNCEKALYFQPNESGRIVLTPAKDYWVNEFKVSNGTETVTVSAAKTSFTLGGVSHSVAVSAAGVVTIVVTPGIGNVKLYDITTTNNTCNVSVVADSTITVSSASQNVVKGKNVTVTMTPKKNYSVDEIKVVANGTTTTADVQYDSYIVVNGVRCPIAVASNGKVTLTLNQVTTDVRVYAESEYTGDYDYIVTVNTETGISTSASKLYVEDGDDASITFTPSNHYSVEEITVKRNGKTYTADPAKDDEIVIAGVSCPIKLTEKTGVVKLTLKDVDMDMTVKADSSYSSRDYVMKDDGHSKTTYSGTLKKGNTVTFTIDPDSNYEIRSVKIYDGDDTKTIYPDDDSFTMNGKKYTVDTKSNGNMTIKVSLPSELTITVTTIKSGSSVVSGIHNAYINGYADGTFKPDNTITRGAAIAMLSRQYSGMADAQLSAFANSSRYSDVPSTNTFAGAIGWAASRGYLDCIARTGSALLPAQAITRAEFVALLCEFENADPADVTKSDFDDVSKNYWAIDQIAYATDREWIFGYSNGDFRPDNSITRAEIVTIINRVLGRDYRNEGTTSISSLRTFSDVPSSYWAYYDILEASSTHYVSNR